MDDVRAVMDAVGSKQATLLGSSEGGPMSILFSASYPQQTSGLILYGAMARVAWSVDYPWGITAERFAARLKFREENWGQGQSSIEIMTPSLASNEEYRKWVGRLGRDYCFSRSGTRSNPNELLRSTSGVLPTVSVSRSCCSYGGPSEQCRIWSLPWQAYPRGQVH
jgi:pimeloyl-ACP methyl ester carboxylesterase